MANNVSIHGASLSIKLWPVALQDLGQYCVDDELLTEAEVYWTHLLYSELMYAIALKNNIALTSQRLVKNLVGNYESQLSHPRLV